MWYLLTKLKQAKKYICYLIVHNTGHTPVIVHGVHGCELNDDDSSILSRDYAAQSVKPKHALKAIYLKLLSHKHSVTAL